MAVKEDSEKAGLKLSIWKTKIMAPGPITSWQTEGKKWKQWQTIFFISKLTADGDCSHKIKKTFASWKKKKKDACSYDKPGQHIKKQRYHFADKRLSSQNYGFFQ